MAYRSACRRASGPVKISTSQLPIVIKPLDAPLFGRHAIFKDLRWFRHASLHLRLTPTLLRQHHARLCWWLRPRELYLPGRRCLLVLPRRAVESGLAWAMTSLPDGPALGNNEQLVSGSTSSQPQRTARFIIGNATIRPQAL
jgi:hypothetical protein